MNKVKVKIKNRTLLELEEDAKAGDLIDLSEVYSVDFELINNLILKEKDKVYQKMLDEERASLIEKHNLMLKE